MTNNEVYNDTRKLLGKRGVALRILYDAHPYVIGWRIKLPFIGYIIIPRKRGHSWGHLFSQGF